MPEQLAAMSGDAEKLNSKLERVAADGQLMESAAKNIRNLLAGAASDLYSQVVNELVAADAWPELNDRFYQTLTFGTGGLRGRTIGRIVTKAERGDTAHNAVATARPQFPCVATNAMKFFNISPATQGLVAYVHDWNKRANILAKPKIVIAHDPRFFSDQFAQLTAKLHTPHG